MDFVEFFTRQLAQIAHYHLPIGLVDTIIEFANLEASNEEVEKVAHIFKNNPSLPRIACATKALNEFITSTDIREDFLKDVIGRLGTSSQMTGRRQKDFCHAFRWLRIWRPYATALGQKSVA